MIENLEQWNLDSAQQLSFLHLNQEEQGPNHVFLQHGNQEMTMKLIRPNSWSPELKQVFE